ncbi:exodeoxyribonuclease III [Terricaulis silvestris]|uniref:Exodeoxyribonuclease III n=1 Tax=Terricaulis silvestris TaxID=2686094 RepID=A0A6I6MPM6_9CAUL|nr:exodeoxyribonuclease III [Terricaulis silvestris]QGZ94824.1 Exodeoxyribonuclease III [Terricaulis silvestris]
MALKIAAWNVNSILARLPTALKVFEDVGADIWCLQEIKCEDPRFPRLEFEAMGYNVETFGQKSYNGVAILSKYRIEEFTRGIPGLEHEHSRYIEAVIAAPGGPVRVASIYAPNGNPIGTEKFQFKLQFMEALRTHLQSLLPLEERFVIAGDYNVIPRDVDCVDPRTWVTDALFQSETRAAYRALQNIGLTDAYMQADGAAHKYTFWDYQAGAWQRDNGIRIDHLLLSPQAADALENVDIYKKARSMEKASDHVPIIGTFAD